MAYIPFLNNAYFSAKVGIGTTSPAQNFVVADATNGNGIELVPAGTGTIQAYNRGTSLYNTLNIDSLSNRIRSVNETVFNNGSGFSESMRITAAGILMVGGTTGGYAGTEIHVGNFTDTQNGINILTSTTGYGYVLFGDGTGADTYRGQITYYHGDDSMSFNTNGSKKLTILSSGNVGIGTTVFPYSPKIAITSSASAKNTLSIQTTDVAAGTAGTILYLGLGTSTGNSTYGSIRALGNGGTAIANLVLQSDGGNVGIGTDSPGAVLSVRNPTAGTSAFSLQHSTTSSIFDFQTGIANVTGNALVIKDVANSYDYLTLRGGNVGIGTVSPTAKLQVSGKSFFTNDIFTLQNKGIFFNGLDDFSSGIAGIDSGTSVRIFAGGSEKVRVKSTGNVGIGTTGPNAKLDVKETTSDVAGEIIVGGLIASDNVPFGKISFANTATANTQTNDVLASIAGEKVGSSNRGELTFLTSDSAAPVERMRIGSDGNVTMEGALNVAGVSTLANVGYLGDGLGSVQYTLQSANDGYGIIDFGDVADVNIGRLSYNHNDNSFLIRTNNATALTLNSSQNATFAGDVNVGGTSLKLTGTSYNNITSDANVDIGVSSSAHNVAGYTTLLYAGSPTAGTTNNIAGGHLYLAGGAGKGTGAGGDIVFRVAPVGSSGSTVNAYQTALTISDNKSATFQDQAFSAATSSGDASSTLTTKGYVDSLITGATIYRGAWQAGISATSSAATTASTTLTVTAAILDADGNTPVLVGAVVTGAGITGIVKVASVTSSTVYVLDTAITATATAYIFSPIYGAPDLSGVTETSGYYYICSEAGSATPNGANSEPNTWAVGDWCIYNDVSGTGQWQKIDNSSVLSGVGTGQTVALWEGAGSVTDSETLGNAPITVSGNNTTITGKLGVGAVNTSYNLYNNGTTYFNGATIVDAAFTQSGGAASTFSGDVTVSGGDLTINSTGNAVLNVNGTANSFIEKDTGTDLYIANNVGDKDIKFRVKDNTTNVIALTLDGSEGGNATFSGDVSLADNKYLNIGASNDLKIHHSSVSNDSFISETGLGDLYILSDTGVILKSGALGENYANFTKDGPIELYYDNSKKFETSSVGISVAGSVQIADDTDTAVVGKVGTMRYRTGTEYVEVTGTELITNGDFATDSDWTKETGWSIGSGVASYNGSSANNGLYENLSLTTGTIYRLSFTIVNYVSGTLVGALSSGGLTGNTPNITADGDYVFNLTATGVLCIFRSTSSFNGSIDNVSLIEVTAEDASYADMCMQTGASTYEWVNIVRNTY